MNKLFSIKKDSQYAVVSFLSFSIVCSNCSEVGLIKQILNKIVKKIKTMLGFKYKIYGNKRQFYIEAPSPDSIFHSFNSYFKGGISNAYLNLTNGLDAQSVKEAQRIIDRLKKTLKHPFSYLRFEPEFDEKSLIIDIETKLKSKITKNSDGAFSYQDFILPLNEFSENVFYFRYGIEDILRNDKTEIDGNTPPPPVCFYCR
ncbi:MAG: hypothetical protein LBH29_05990 [Elusimicrobiota bacterium]|jgi:hypothetical protein|nr:hypothetical protein [Elusimicrobiota bacterium]